MNNENFEFQFEVSNEDNPFDPIVSAPDGFIKDPDSSEGVQTVTEESNTEEQPNETIEETVETSETTPSTDNTPSENEEKPKIESQDESQEYTTLFKNHFQMLKEAGLVYTEDVELNEDASNIEEVLQKNEMARTQMIAEQLVESLPEKLRDIVQYGLSGGNDLDRFFQTEQKAQSFNYDISNEADQEKVLREFLKSKGNDDFAISAIIDRAKDDDKLKDLSENAYSSLKETFEKEKQTLIEQSKEQKQRQEALLKERHQNVVETIKKQEKWKPQAKQEIYSMIYKPDDKYNGNSYIGAVLNKISSTPEQLVQFTKLITDQYDFEKGFKIEEMQEKSNKIKSGLRDQLGAVLSKGSLPNSYMEEKPKQIDWSKTEVVLPEWH